MAGIKDAGSHSRTPRYCRHWNSMDTDCRELSCLLAVAADDAYEPPFHGVVIGIGVTAGLA